MNLMIVEASNRDEDDDLAPDRAAAEVLDTLSLKIPKHVFPPVLEFATLSSQSVDPKFREASVTVLGVVSEGCFELMKEKLGPVLHIVLGALRDPEQVVRGASSFALGQFAEYLQPEITSHYETVLPSILNALEDSSDDVKFILQTHGLRAGEESAKKTIGFIEAVISVGKQDGVKGYWKGNLAQVIRILPYSAVQLFAYESYKKLFRGEDGELSVIGRLAAGASAGMTSTFVTYPLDVLRLRMAVDPGHQTMPNVIVRMIKEEGLGSFYKGLVPSLISIAPYVAVNFCVFDLVKKTLPENFQNKTEASFITAFMAATIATVTCYPLDTIRRQMQMRGTPYNTVLDAFSGIIARDGVAGLYRGFVPNALKTLPNSSIRLTTFDAMKRLIAASEKEYQRILEENRNEQKLGSSSTS
ncbi:carrier protein [Artemisia annua]|uniref:Carrier protein n=1 Tax=Artemisia annua TaxID=35608 RepID=A0A2U1N5V8_ARTAN|nr:carrier protein [Artemisia annua]